MFRRGLFLGKFMPLHEGHLDVINVAAGLCDELDILVCTQPGDPIEGMLRYGWVVQEVRHLNNVVVNQFHKTMPQTPAEDEYFWDKWMPALRKGAPYDTVFGGEDYVIELARRLQAKPFIVDREQNKVSATQIRQWPTEYFQYLPTSVKPYYQKRIALVGPESVGKTRIAKVLADTWYTTPVYEYGRQYDELVKGEGPWEEQDFLNIIEGHRAIRKLAQTRNTLGIIEDTEEIMTAVWAKRLWNGDVSYIDSVAQNSPRADLYLLLAPTTPWVDDGTRVQKDRRDRERMFGALYAMLRNLGVNFKILAQSDYKRREKAAIDEMNQIL